MTRGPLLDMVRSFSFPRRAGTDGERRAADRVAEEFASAGLDVHVHDIRVSRAAMFRVRLFVHGLVAIALVCAGIALPWDPLGAAAASVAGLAVMAAAGRWRIAIESVFDWPPHVESRNVEGRRGTPDPDACCIVVMAHLDSKSTALPALVPTVVLIAAIVFLLVTAIWCTLAVVTHDAGPPFGAAALVLAGIVVAITFNRIGNASPGAMDNASGLAVLLASARRLAADEELESVQLRFLATGAEEIGLAGAMRWIQEHGPELDPSRTLFVNVDSVGVGHTLVVADLRGNAADGRPLAEVLRRAAAETDVPVRRVPFLPSAGVDTMPIGARGFPTITLLGEVFGTAARRFHSSQDRPEYLNERGLERAVALVEGIVRDAARRARMGTDARAKNPTGGQVAGSSR